MILGFIGTGKISSSIIFGIFKSKLKVKKIYISSRNRNIAKKLTKKYRKITILNNNQEIIDKSSTIILGVTPNVGSTILPKLKFSKNKKIVSLISTINLEKLKKLTKNKNNGKGLIVFIFTWLAKLFYGDDYEELNRKANKRRPPRNRPRRRKINKKLTRLTAGFFTCYICDLSYTTEGKPC